MSPLTVIYFVILLTVFVIGMVRYKKLTIPIKILTYSVMTILLLEILAEIFGKIFKNNAIIFHIESVVGYIFYALTYFYLFKSKPVKNSILISIILIIIFSLFNILLIQQPSKKLFPTNIYMITNVLYVVYSLLLFKQMLQYPLNLNIVKQSGFWFNTAIIFFSTTMFINLGLINYYAQHKWGYDIIYYFWAGSFYLFNVFICISLITDNKVSST